MMDMRLSHTGQPSVPRQIEILIQDFEKLANRLAADTEIAALCTRVESILEIIRQNLGANSRSLGRRASQAAQTADSYVRARPWRTLGCVALGAAAVGFFAARRQ